MIKIFSLSAFFVYVIAFIIILNSDVKALDVGPRGPHPKIMEQLTEEQQKEVKSKLEELWKEGASREEIRDTIHKMVEEYGIDIPEEGKGFPLGCGKKSGGSHESPRKRKKEVSWAAEEF